MFGYDFFFHLYRGSNNFSFRFASITILLRPHGGLFNNNLLENKTQNQEKAQQIRAGGCTERRLRRN
jgi:hypothetical protein